MNLRLAALTAAILIAGPAFAEPPVWVVRDADSEMLLFGSVHVLPPELRWRPAALDAALTAADDIWFEIPVDDATAHEIGRLASLHGTLPPGQSLFGLLSPADAARLVRIAGDSGVNPQALDRLKPWLAEVALASALYGKAGAASDHGVEATLSAAAPAATARRALETPADQIALFSETPMADQIASLLGSMAEIEADPDTFTDLLKVWMAGDVVGLARETQSLREASPALFRRLVTLRNAAWVTMLDARLKGRGRTVVVVGAGHLVGEDGVPARLRALGYSVTGP
jgi:uncharacterized protein